MGDTYLMVCRSCKTAEWLADYEIPEYIEDHTAHDFTLLPPQTRDNSGEFRIWFLKFLGWPVKEEG